ncbi:UvrD-helicase domain-containing protein [Candidatus Saccharibacteria bacterium]|nr:UvrD-helicase domain-containing protein [Candidatus Saccharibacteria bacterium]
MSEVKDIQRWFKNNVRDNGKIYTLDKNQAKIVCDHHKNALVTARAGSGKTRTIVAKIVYLLAHEQYYPEEIIVFAFNRKACQEINERLTKITFNSKSLFKSPPTIATTFHAFSYQLLGGKNVLKNRLLIPDETDARFSDSSSQFITRAEQQFFQDYQILENTISQITDHEKRQKLDFEFQKLKDYHQKLQEKQKLNFNQLIAMAAEKLESVKTTPYRFILIDEYQDFSLLFLTLIKDLRKTCNLAHLLSVGDDWQAINRFAGSDVEFFTNFSKYFPEDSIKLFIPTNYRSGKKIVKNANFFMSKALKDYAGCKAKNRGKSQIFYHKTENYLKTVQEIISKNPNKSIKILSRNNNIRYKNQSLEHFVSLLNTKDVTLSFSTIHRSKGLEADIVILLEIDAGKFPSPDKTNGLYDIFGDTTTTLFADEARLFYVALTRAKEKLYILSKNPTITKENQKYNFFSYLNPDYLDPLL